MEFSSFGDTYKTIHGYLALIVCGIGIFMNMLLILVLMQKQMRTATNCILASIAVSDIVLMTFNIGAVTHESFLSEATKGCVGDNYQQTFGWATFMLIHANVSVTAHGISTWLTICLASLRLQYRIIRAKHAMRVSIKTGVRISLIVMVSVATALSPLYISQGISIRKPNCSVESGIVLSYMVGPSQISRSLNDRPLSISYWNTAVVMKAFPCILLTISIGLLVVKTSQREKKNLILKNPLAAKSDATDVETEPLASKNCRRNGSSRNRLQQHNPPRCHYSERMNRMLICILAMFLVCQMPQVAVNLIGAFRGKEYRSGIYRHLGLLLDDLSLLSGCVNLFLYCIMSTQFRHTFSLLFGWDRVTNYFRAHKDHSASKSISLVKCPTCHEEHYNVLVGFIHSCPATPLTHTTARSYKSNSMIETHL